MSRLRGLAYIIGGILATALVIFQSDMLMDYRVTFQFLPDDIGINAQHFMIAGAVGLFGTGLYYLIVGGRKSTTAVGIVNTGYVAAPSLAKTPTETRTSTQKFNKVAATTPAQKWSIAAAGNLIRRNGDSFDTLNSNVPMVQRLLVKWWDVHNTEELVEMLTWLAQTGHRESFKSIYQKVKGISIEQLDKIISHLPEDQAKTIHFVWENQDKFANGDLLAWDMGRYINLIRFGYAAGYLDEQTSWTQMIAAARQLQYYHKSWQDLSDNYLLGWRFWQKGAEISAADANAAKWLTTSPDSPWAKLAWDTSLN
jgi:hypothetical protein